MLKKPMLLVPKKPDQTTKKPPEAVKKPVKKRQPPSETLKQYPDEYHELFPSKRVQVDDNREVVISVRRGGEEGLVHVDIRYYQNTPVYTGFTKKGITIPIEAFAEVMSDLNDTLQECDEEGLFDEE